MPTESFFAGFFADPEFKKKMNYNYFPTSRMQASVRRIREASGNDAEFSKHIRYGNYQTLLTPIDTWPGETGKKWKQALKEAREDLDNLRNEEQISDAAGDESVPKTRLALLEAVLTKCFTTTLPGEKYPGIPMHIDVKKRSPDDPGRKRHEINISWTYDPQLHVPIQLNWTMLCPNPDKSIRRAAGKSARTVAKSKRPAKKKRSR